MKRHSKNLLFFQDVLFCKDKKGIKVRDPRWRFLLFFRKYFENISIIAPCKNGCDDNSFVPIKREFYFWALPPWGGYKEYLLKLPFIFLPFIVRAYKAINKHRVIWLRFPSLAGFVLFLIAYVLNKRVVIEISANIKNAWEPSKYQSSVAKRFVIFSGRCMDFLQKFIVKKRFLLTTGKDLERKYKNYSSFCLHFLENYFNEEDYIKKQNFDLHKPVRILYVGRLMELKGLQYLLEAIRMLIKEGKKVTLWIVGGGPLEKWLKKEVLNKKIHRYVKFFGPLPYGDKLFKIYKESDIFILPSLSEGFPRVIIEAFFFQLPVITTPVGGLKYFIKHMENGILVCPRDPYGIKEAVKKLIENKGLRKKIIYNQYKEALHYAGDKQAEKIVNAMYKYLKIESTF